MRLPIALPLLALLVVASPAGAMVFTRQDFVSHEKEHMTAENAGNIASPPGWTRPALVTGTSRREKPATPESPVSDRTRTDAQPDHS